MLFSRLTTWEASCLGSISALTLTDRVTLGKSLRTFLNARMKFGTSIPIWLP